MQTKANNWTLISSQWNWLFLILYKIWGRRCIFGECAYTPTSIECMLGNEMHWERFDSLNHTAYRLSFSGLPPWPVGRMHLDWLLKKQGWPTLLQQLSASTTAVHGPAVLTLPDTWPSSPLPRSPLQLSGRTYGFIMHPYAGNS